MNTALLLTSLFLVTLVRSTPLMLAINSRRHRQRSIASALICPPDRSSRRWKKGRSVRWCEGQNHR
jgi:hypothetical protein